MGWLSDKLFGKRKSLDLDKLKDYMAPTQDLVNEQLGISRNMMDPNSLMNIGMRNYMQSQAATQGAQIGSQMEKMAAMTGTSPGQAMMQARMGMSGAMSGVEDDYLQWMQGQQQQGLGLMGNMTGMMQGLNENEANAYVQSINAHNAKRASRVGMFTSLAGAAIGAFTGGAPKPADPTTGIG
tara:strand:- start:61 stop:606 length:546 start_codon:yes stop_codon:yes gene_type:complete